MKFLAVAILASGAMAATRAGTMNKHAEGIATSSRISKAAGGGEYVDGQVSNNWAGATNSGKGITYVTGEVTVPEPRIPSGGDQDTTYLASAWVGIDGNSCRSGLLQTGVEVAVQGSNTKYSAWFEWIPDYSHDFDITINKGDKIRMTVDATSLDGGWAAIENLSTGKSANHTFPAQDNKLCLTDAEWIVERFDQVVNGVKKPVPYANTGTVEFTNCFHEADGTKVDLSGANLISMVDDNKETMTKCSVSGSDGLQCITTN